MELPSKPLQNLDRQMDDTLMDYLTSRWDTNYLKYVLNDTIYDKKTEPHGLVSFLGLEEASCFLKLLLSINLISHDIEKTRCFDMPWFLFTQSENPFLNM